MPEAIFTASADEDSVIANALEGYDRNTIATEPIVDEFRVLNYSGY